jgi:hypothetical protein
VLAQDGGDGGEVLGHQGPFLRRTTGREGAADLPNDRFYGVQRALADLTGTLPELERLHDEYDARTGRIRPVGLAWTNTNVASLMTVLDDLERFLGADPDAFLAGDR